MPYVSVDGQEPWIPVGEKPKSASRRSTGRKRGTGGGKRKKKEPAEESAKGSSDNPIVIEAGKELVKKIVGSGRRGSRTIRRLERAGEATIEGLARGAGKLASGLGRTVAAAGLGTAAAVALGGLAAGYLATTYVRSAIEQRAKARSLNEWKDAQKYRIARTYRNDREIAAKQLGRKLYPSEQKILADEFKAAIAAIDNTQE